MWWVKVKKYWNIASLWCRQHWRWVLFAFASIIVYAVARRKNRAELIQAKLALKHYQKEKDAIEKAYEKEIKMREEAKNKYDSAMNIVKDKYKNDFNSNNMKKEAEIRKKLKQKS